MWYVALYSVDECECCFGSGCVMSYVDVVKWCGGNSLSEISTFVAVVLDSQAFQRYNGVWDRCAKSTCHYHCLMSIIVKYGTILCNCPVS